MNSCAVPEKALRQRPWGKLVDFGPPPGNEEIRGLESCGTLPVLVDDVADRDLPIHRSYWVPTAEELERLNAGQPVQLQVWGTQVPVGVSVDW